MDVVIKGTAGVPTYELIAAVDAVVQVNRPINDDVLVKGPVPVNIDLACTLELTYGDPDDIMNEVDSRLRAMFQDPSPVPDVAPLQVGEDLTLDRLVHEIMAVSGIKRVIWVTPAADVAVGGDGLAVLASVALSTSWASEV